MLVGVLFPGQASQYPGMGKELHDSFASARAVFEEASDALGFDVAELCFHGSEQDLQLTENTQPAIFTVSVAAYRVLEEETGLRPLCAAGHSLGEYSALAAAGVLRVGEAVRVLRSRGRYMQDAVPVGRGAMAALMGLSAAQVEEVCRAAAQAGLVEPANFNGAEQIVISGEGEAVRVAMEAARAAGAKRVVALPVSAPFHCALMRPAAARLAPELGALSLSPFRFPVIANVTAERYPSEAAVPDLLERQITAPVRWDGCVGAMRAMGVDAFLEVGPGKVLSGLVRRICREARVASFGAPADLDGALALIG